MSWWTSIRDAVESVASVAGNYFLPGSGLITSQLTRKGSQQQLSSPLGMLAQIGSGAAGAGIGSDITGISSAADAGYGWGNAWDAMSGAGSFGTPAYSVEGVLGGGTGIGSQATGGGAYGGYSVEGVPGGGTGTGLTDWAQNQYNGGGLYGQKPSDWKDWVKPLMSVGSGLYGMKQAADLEGLAMQAQQGSSPWAESGGMATAGAQLQGVMSGDFTNDAGFAAAQRAAAATSSQQPGGFAAKAAADAALQYQNQRIQALSAPAGVGFSPAQGYATAIGALGAGNQLASQSLGSIGYGVSSAMNSSAQMPPWLQAYLLQNGMGRQVGVV